MPEGAAATATGRATVTFTWPSRSRLIPLAANAISVTLTQGAKTLTTQTLARPATGNTATVTFNALPTGTLNVTATAYPNADGTGTAQATATTSIVIQANKNTPFSLTMGSTIDHLEVSPANPTVSPGNTLPLTMTAKDASGNVVLTSPSKMTWNSANTNVATVDASGNLTGVNGGTAKITVTETESGKSATVTATVSGGDANVTID